MADPVESLSAYGRARAKIHSESRPCMRHGVSRRHEHLYFAAETLAPKRRLLNLHGPRVDSRDSTVPDNHNKFAIAVTRARVDPRVFLSLSLQLCAPRITRDAQARRAFPANWMPNRQSPIESGS